MLLSELSGKGGGREGVTDHAALQAATSNAKGGCSQKFGMHNVLYAMIERKLNDKCNIYL